MEIQLTQGKVAQVDPADHAWLSQWKWRASKNHVRGRIVWYVARSAPRGETQRRQIYMHRLIFPDAPIVDHVDGDGLNNRRGNLRVASRAQNQWNRPKAGVTFDRRRQKWQARLSANGRVFWGGYHLTKPMAEEAYRLLMAKHHGEFQRWNS